MEPVPIGEAARLLGVNTSALRYYEDRGLVRPQRKGGRRVFTREDLRRLAFVQLVHRLGLELRTAAAVLDGPSQEWRAVASKQVKELAEPISQAQAAQRFLTHAANCPAEHPVSECPYLMSTLDRLVAGAAFEELVEEHATEH